MAPTQHPFAIAMITSAAYLAFSNWLITRYRAEAEKNQTLLATILSALIGSSWRTRRGYCLFGCIASDQSLLAAVPLGLHLFGTLMRMARKMPHFGKLSHFDGSQWRLLLQFLPAPLLCMVMWSTAKMYRRTSRHNIAFTPCFVDAVAESHSGLVRNHSLGGREVTPRKAKESVAHPVLRSTSNSMKMLRNFSDVDRDRFAHDYSHVPPITPNAAQENWACKWVAGGGEVCLLLLGLAELRFLVSTQYLNRHFYDTTSGLLSHLSFPPLTYSLTYSLTCFLACSLRPGDRLEILTPSESCLPPYK